MNDNRRPSQGMAESIQTTFTEHPSMGTTVRAVRHRIENDTNGPIRIDGTDIYSRPTFNGTGQYYQNVSQMVDDSSNTSKQSFSAKRDFFEQRVKPSSSSNYDTPPRQTTSTVTPPSPSSPPRQIITTITTTTSPSVEQLLNEATELQKLANIDPKSKKQDTRTPLIIERSEQYQVFLDPTNHEVHRTPSVARVSVVPPTRIGQTTDVDQTQMKIDRVADDHQAIHHLTRALQEHNINTMNDFKRLPSQTTPILVNTTTTTTTTTTATPPETIASSTANQNNPNQYFVVDALLNNPVTPSNEKKRLNLQARLDTIVSNVRNSNFKNLFRQSSRQKKNDDDVSNNPLSSSAGTTSVGISAQPLTTSSQITKKSKKSQKKGKSTSSTTPTEYYVIDAILGTPITQNLPESLKMKYKNIFPSTTNQTTGVVSKTTPTTPSTPPGPNKPRILYRYLDERGNVLKISAVPPSQLHESIPSSATVISTSNNDVVRRVITDRIARFPTTAISADQLASINREKSPHSRSIPVEITTRGNPNRTASQPPRSDSCSSPYPIQLSLLPHTYQSEDPLKQRRIVGYDTDSTISEPTLASRTFDQRTRSANRSPDEFRRTISPDFCVTGMTRNYIEVFRDGENKPSETYSVPFTSSLSTSPTFAQRYSRFDQYQNEQRTPSFRQTTLTSPTMTNPINQDSPILSNDSTFSSKPFDYRPLRSKLQRDLQNFSALLVDESDPPASSTATVTKKIDLI